MAGNIRLLLLGSIVPIGNTREDDLFEKTYQLRYADFGCVMPPVGCVIQYNRRIVEYLDATFGQEWRKSVRKDVVGYKEK